MIRFGVIGAGRIGKVHSGFSADGRQGQEQSPRVRPDRSGDAVRATLRPLPGPTHPPRRKIEAARELVSFLHHSRHVGLGLSLYRSKC
jgi:hypothetical protein